MTKSTVLFLMMAFAGLFITACEEEAEPLPEENWEEVMLDTREYGSWVYFSFAQNAEVEISDFKNSMDWDIGFHRFDVRVNCGSAGPGQGGSRSMGVVDFESVKEAPADGYSLNDSISIIAVPGDWENPVTVPGDTILATWMSFSGPPPTYTMSNEIYVIKTAGGNYVRLWLKDYFNDMSASGYVTMRYTYQPDGSRSFDY
jgi:hypothetical protein